MKNPLRSSFSTEGRRMAGARALWRANGMKEEQFGNRYRKFIYPVRAGAYAFA